MGARGRRPIIVNSISVSFAICIDNMRSNESRQRSVDLVHTPRPRLEDIQYAPRWQLYNYHISAHNSICFKRTVFVFLGTDSHRPRLCNKQTFHETAVPRLRRRGKDHTLHDTRTSEAIAGHASTEFRGSFATTSMRSCNNYCCKLLHRSVSSCPVTI